MLPKTTISTASPLYDSTGAPLVGALVTFQLDRDDVDRITGSFVMAAPASFFVLDETGSLPLGCALWANENGSTGSRWMIGISLGSAVIQRPVPMMVKALVSPASMDLITLLQDAVLFPGSRPA